MLRKILTINGKDFPTRSPLTIVRGKKIMREEPEQSVREIATCNEWDDYF
jgi:hypothetical protein